MLHNGLYEQIINKDLESELSITDKLSQTAPIDSAEASKLLAKYIAEVVEQGLNNVKDNGGDLNTQVELVNRIVSTIKNETKEADFDALSVAERAEQLLALFDKQNSILALDEKANIIRPETSIAQSSLFTGAIHEPQMFTELKKEIVSCNKIAEGEAEALLKMKQAEADGIKLLKEAKADQAVLTLKSYETLSKISDGQSTKIIIPSNMEGIASFGTVLNEMLEKKEK